MTSLICGVLQKKGTFELIYKTEIGFQMQETNMIPRGWGGGGVNWEMGIDIYILLYIKQITNRTVQ